MEKGRGRGKYLDYIIIESFYSFDQSCNNSEREKSMIGDYFLGKVHFGNNCAGFIPKDWENLDFKENFDGLISILEEEKLKLLSKKEWRKMWSENQKNN